MLDIFQDYFLMISYTFNFYLFDLTTAVQCSAQCSEGVTKSPWSSEVIEVNLSEIMALKVKKRKSAHIGIYGYARFYSYGICENITIGQPSKPCGTVLSPLLNELDHCAVANPI